MTKAELEAIKAREKNATPGPWKEPRWWSGSKEGQTHVPYTQADAEFIAHAREDIPVLVAEVERLRNANLHVRSGGCFPGGVCDDCQAIALDDVEDEDYRL